MRVALVITTYERPDALAAVLASVARQSVSPDEIVIADDGSGEPTRELIGAYAARSSVPVRFVSQPHKGFRLTRLRNLAIAATPMDYLVFVDGDMVLHPDFIADHVRHARRGRFTQGVRVRADTALTGALIADPALRAGFFAGGLGGLRRLYLLHSRRLAALTRRAANAFVAIKGCNQAFWRDDLVRVNGFNERIQGWGPEDKELCARLENAGVQRQTLLFGGIAVHLDHPPAARQQLAANLAVYADTRRERKVRCESGLDAHLSEGMAAQVP
jgi:glycosyltransferase involved in cell wall biosynthesis